MPAARNRASATKVRKEKENKTTHVQENKKFI
jgi:hypothetical protein